MTTASRKSAGEQAYATATEKLVALEAAAATARHLRARAIQRMRDDGYSWARIEETTGLTRQRLNAIVRSAE
jgi:hypothetical protein